MKTRDSKQKQTCRSAEARTGRRHIVVAVAVGKGCCPAGSCTRAERRTWSSGDLSRKRLDSRHNAQNGQVTPPDAAPQGYRKLDDGLKTKFRAQFTNNTPMPPPASF